MSGLDGRSAVETSCGSGRKETRPKGGSGHKKKNKIQQRKGYSKEKNTAKKRIQQRKGYSKEKDTAKKRIQQRKGYSKEKDTAKKKI